MWELMAAVHPTSSRTDGSATLRRDGAHAGPHQGRPEKAAGRGAAGVEQTSAPDVTSALGSLSVWRRDGEDWKLAADARIHSVDKASAERLVRALDSSLRDRGVDWVSPPSDAAAALYAADSAFSVLAQRSGIPAAFAAYAAPDAAMFPASGEIVRGPDGIRDMYADWPPTAPSRGVP